MNICNNLQREVFQYIQAVRNAACDGAGAARTRQLALVNFPPPHSVVHLILIVCCERPFRMQECYHLRGFS